MKRKKLAFITGLVMAASSTGYFPVHADAVSDTYLIRDKWGYCKTANYAESEHFVIFYGNNDITGHVDDAFLKRNLENYESLWKCYGEYLGMENMNVDIYGKSQQKYKTNVYLTNTGLDKYPEGWAFMSSEDGYGIEIISPDAMLDELTIAHEFGHVVTMQQKSWVDQEITGAWWEPLANWFREMYISSEFYHGDVQTGWFEPYIRNMSLAFPHGRNYYEVWPFLVYLSNNPAYITVTAMPEKLYRVNAFDKENKTPYKTSDSKRRYPYSLILDGADVQRSGGYSRGRGHVHSNGGGWVSDTAKVDSSVYVGKAAMVLGNAVLTGNVRVEDYAVVAGNAVISDNAVIYGHAVVNGGGWVYDNGWIQGTVRISENAIIGDSAVVSNSCTVSGNASVIQKAFLADAVTVKDNATVKGMAYLYGKGSYNGQVILDGDYANEESLSFGTAFGWLDTAGKSYTDGLIAGYDFNNASSVWASDRYAATNALIKDAEYQKERTSASGVISFDGINDSISLDDSVIRKNNIQISAGVLWKGGTSVQELFRAGDENAYISFTPCSKDGRAELTLSDGNITEKLTAPGALEKGEWSKVTVKITDGKGTLTVNGKNVASGELSLTPLSVLSAAQTDAFTVGKGSENFSSFKGALDYINFYFKESEEPDIVYSEGEEADSFIKGDVNLDGVLSAADILLMTEYFHGVSILPDNSAADISDDGIINISDLVLLKNLIIKYK